ncbi:uncharacterized protein F5147DRAFT_585136, partial [Suillus discolor]
DLVELSGNIETEDRETISQYNEEVLEDDLQDNDKGWVNEVDLLRNTESAELQKNIRPIKFVLLKLRKLTYKLIHSTTLLLPAWHRILRDQQMSVTNMPRDVSTCWNLTYDMLAYALAHRKAINAVTQQ